MAKLAAPVVVVPGITASYLRDSYDLPPEVVWSVLRKDFERVALHPDDLRFEAREPARVLADQVFEIAYKELISELRHNLAEKDDKPVPVYPFAYDWRQPLATIEEELSAFIDEVADRTRLLRHYDADGYSADPVVNLVGHSMGGLVIAGCLRNRANSGARVRVAKVATLASPFRGSFEAVLKIVTGTANLGGSDSASREREVARLTPALYHLLPSFPGALTDPSGAPVNLSLFDPDIWQPGVVKTIAEYVRLHGLNKKDQQQQATELFSGLHQMARAHRERLESFALSDAGLAATDWLCVVGVGAKTRVRLRLRGTDSRPEFDLASEDRLDEWREKPDSNPPTPLNSALTGDGTVPFQGAVPAFLRLENLVCVCPSDYGYWEVADRVLTSAAGFHGILPNMDMLHRLIVRHFTGRPDKHGNTWGRPAPGVSGKNWAPPIAGLKDKSAD